MVLKGNGRDFTASLVDAAPVIVLLLDDRGIIQYVNPYFEQLTGYRLEEIRGKEWFSTLLPERDQERSRVLFQTVVNDVSVRGNINPIVTRNGEEREIEWQARAIREGQGCITAVLSIGLDITERKQAEEQYRNILKTAIDGFWTTDSRGRLLEVNDSYCRMSGYSREELLGMRIPDIEAAENPAETAKRIEKIIAQGSARFESRHRRRDGTVIDVEISTKYSNEQGGIFTVFIQDITERKRSEEALRRTNRALRTLSKCSEVVMRARSEQDLLHHGCQAIVAEGGYLMAWVGYAENDEAKTVRPVQGCGYDDKYLETVKISWADTEYGGGPAGAAIRTGKHLVVRNVQTDPRFRLWRDEAVRRGYASVIGLPLKTGDSVLGALTIYAAEPEAFDSDELRLLMELAENISFGITAVRTREAREVAETQLRRNYDTQSVVNEILRISLSDVELHAILHRALDLVLAIPWLSAESRGAIFLADNKRNELVLKVQKGLSEEVQEECAAVPFGMCLCGRAALTRESQFADRIDERHDNCSEDVQPHGHYCVPIVSAGRTLGVISLCLGEGHTEDEKEKAFLDTIANVLAGVIQRKQTEEERGNLYLELQDAFGKVSRSKKEWQDTFDAITDLIVILDKDRRIIRANRAVAEYFSLEVTEILNKTCHEILHSLQIPEKSCPFMQTLDAGQSLSCEVSDEKNKKTYQISVFPYYSGRGEKQGMVHIARDITVEKENEMRLVMSERLASLGQMASGIAHEINNPLAAIAGCTEGLLLRLGQERFEPELFKSYLKIIGEEISRCKNITSGMLSFVRKTTYDTQDVDVQKTLDKTLAITGFQGRLKEVEIIKNYTGGLPLLHGSEGELRQVFLAIIINALEAMCDRGKLTLETGTEGENIFIKITDTGPGISPEHVSRIFDPFYTTRGKKGGTGLGLAIAGKIINNHRGIIEVSSEEGKGTTFKITLPL